jgi:chemotaxis protein MotB
MRRQKQAEAENHERWLVSYADFITLLFAFFVVMFASSQTDKGRAKQISEAVEKALADGKSVSVRPVVATILGGTVDDKGQGNAQMKGPGGAQHAAKEAPPEILELAASLKSLSADLADEIKAGKVEVSMQPRGLVVSLQQTAFFPSGTDLLAAGSLTTIAKLADALKGLSNPIRIEGHTDAIPIHTERFHSNWELSAARAITMMDVLAKNFNIPYERMAIVGYAQTMPVASNDTEEGRARNRRVDMVILNNYAFRTTEPPRATEAARK